MQQKKAPFKFVKVSARRRQFLDNWRRERAIDLAIKEADEAEVESCDAQLYTAEDVTWSIEPPVMRPHDQDVCAGDVRLLDTHHTTERCRFAYVAVLRIDKKSSTTIIAPFSPYVNPASKSEWLTGFEHDALKVLQFWNSFPVPLKCMRESWRIGSMSPEQLEAAWSTYQHTIADTWPADDIRENIGLAIHNPDDERLQYQAEEYAVYQPLRRKLFNLMALIERPKRHFHLSMQVSLPLAAASGESSAIALLLGQDGKQKEQFTAVRLGHDFSGEEYDSRWRIENIKVPLTGLPASIYDHEDNLIDTTTIEGDNGNLVIFSGTDSTTFERLDGLNLKMVISEI